MSRGHDRERDICKLLAREGWVTVRAAGSMGSIDVVAAAHGKVTWVPEWANWRYVPGETSTVCVEHGLLFIEVKSTNAGPWATFGPQDRAELSAAAAQAGAIALLAWWPPQAGAPTWIAERDWPQPGRSTRRARAPRRKRAAA